MIAPDSWRRFFDRHPRVRAALLVLLIALMLVLIPRARMFEEYGSVALLVICLPAPVYSLVRLLRKGHLRRDGDEDDD